METSCAGPQAANGADELITCGDYGATADCAPDRMISPARNGSPSLPSVFANHTTAFTGDPCTAAPTPLEDSLPFYKAAMPAIVMSSLRGSPRTSLSIKTPHDALSATVSWDLQFPVTGCASRLFQNKDSRNPWHG